MPSIQVYLLQRPRVLLNGTELRFPYKKTEALLYYLLVEGHAERSTVVGLLWDDADSTQAYQNLRHALYALRKELGCNFIDPSYKSRLQLNSQLDISCDLWDFLEGNHLEAYQGPFLQDFSVRRAKLFEEWKDTQQIRLQGIYLSALSKQAHKLAQEGDLSHAVPLAEHYLQIDPTDESVTVLLMRLYQKQSQFVKATALYQDLVRRLADDLGITPLKETTAAYYEILNSWNASATWSGPRIGQTPVGKKRPRQFLNDALLSLRTGQERTGALLLQGEPGVGKSFLLEYAHRLGQEQGDLLSVMSSCYPSEQNTPFQPWYSLFMQISAEYGVSLSQLSPFFHAPPQSGEASVPSEVQEDILLYLSQIAQKKPLLLIFEDIHWMDQDSLSLLHQTMRRLRHEPLFILCSCSTLPPERVQTFIYEGKQDGLLEALTVRCFTPEETGEFLSLSGLSHCPPELVTKIYSYTGGNALKLRRLLPTLIEGDPSHSLEEKLEQLFLLRLKNLLPESRQVLDLISIFPAGASFSLLVSVTGRSKLELLCICDDLERRLLIHECQDNDGAEPILLPTPQVQSLLQNQLSRLTRRLLHLRVADCLEDYAALTDEARLEQCAYHFEQGGEEEKSLRCRLTLLNHLLSRPLDPVTSSLGHEALDIQSLFEQLEQSIQKSAALSESLEELWLFVQGRYLLFSGEQGRGSAILHQLIRFGHDESLCRKAHHILQELDEGAAL